MTLLIGVPLETAHEERRVATVPDVVEKLIKLGFSVAVQSGAGTGAKIFNCVVDGAFVAIPAELEFIGGKSRWLDGRISTARRRAGALPTPLPCAR